MNPPALLLALAGLLAVAGLLYLGVAGALRGLAAMVDRALDIDDEEEGEPDGCLDN